MSNATTSIRTAVACSAALAVGLVESSALAQHVHEEVQVGRTTAGQLVMHTHAVMPFALEESVFPGIDGYAGAEVALASLDADHPAIDVFMLASSVDIRAVFLGSDPGILVYNGIAPMTVGSELVLGAPVIHFLPVFNITSGTPGQEFAVRMMFRDASGTYSDSPEFTMRFTPVPGVGVASVMLAGLAATTRRRRDLRPNP